MTTVLLIIQIALILWILRLNLEQSRLKASYRSFMKGKDGKTLEDSIFGRFKELEALEELTNQNKQDILELKNKGRKHYQKFGVVKYDAFQETGECTSFVLVMLDEDNTGWILNIMHSRDSCYHFIKEIVRSKSQIPLTKEEKECLKKGIYQELYEPEERTGMSGNGERE